MASSISIQNYFKLIKMDKFRKITWDVDYISVTESWLNGKDFAHDIALPGMTAHRNDRLVTLRKSGGVACYVKDIYVRYNERDSIR